MTTVSVYLLHIHHDICFLTSHYFDSEERKTDNPRQKRNTISHIKLVVVKANHEINKHNILVHGRSCHSDVDKALSDTK